ncbi:MAG: DUF2461 domain-containing protein [Chryseolinea sp.]
MNTDRALKFIKDLAKHNDRGWFEKNKGRYLEVKEDFENFAAALLGQAIVFDSSLKGLDPRKMTFRIYRDVRFSKDKKPYKSHLGVAFSSVGKSMGTPGYYFQLEPGNKSFVAMGLFMPPPEHLAGIRQEIDYNGDALAKIFSDKKFKRYFSEFWQGDKLKTSPKGFDKDHSQIEWLRLKSFIVEHKFKDDEVADKKFLKKLTDVMRAAKPLNDFLSEAIG